MFSGNPLGILATQYKYNIIPRWVRSNELLLVSDNISCLTMIHLYMQLCDVISQWTDAMLSCPTDTSNILTQPVFTYKKRLFFKRKKTKLTNKEVILLSHQVNINYIAVCCWVKSDFYFSKFQQDVIKNKFPAERDTYIKLTGLMAQVQSLY